MSAPETAPQTAQAASPNMTARSASAVIWDVDGVLLDSADQHRQAWSQLARENELPYSDAAFWATFGMRNADVIPQLFGLWLVHEPERVAALGQRKEEIYRALLSTSAVPLPGAVELMAALHTAGYRQALGSSAPQRNIELIVRLLGIAPYLQAVISGEQVARGKPGPDIFLTAAGALGVTASRSLVIEDAPAGVQAAHAGGMKALAVLRAGRPMESGLDAADQVVESLKEVNVATVDRLLGFAQ